MWDINTNSLYALSTVNSKGKILLTQTVPSLASTVQVRAGFSGVPRWSMQAEKQKEKKEKYVIICML